MTATAADALAGIRSDPVGFCRDVLGFEPWSKQRAILLAVRDHGRVAVRSAHGTGKTRTAAACVLWFLAAYPRSTVVTTAPTWAQVREQLWREVAILHGRAAGFYDGVLSDTKLDLGAGWLAMGLSTDQPERFAGFHGEDLLLVVDEASGVDERIFEAAEGLLTSEGARVLMIGNPTRVSGAFFAAFTKERALWKTIAISALDTPNATGEEVDERARRALVSSRWIEQAKVKWGERSPLYQVRVLGEFPSQSDDSVVALGDVEDAQARKVEPGRPVVVACDVARFGSDETVVVVRRGDHVRIAATWRGRDLMDTTGRILRLARETRVKASDFPTIVVDDVGLGGGVTDRLKEVGEFKVRPFNAGAAARHPRDYPNRRSEAWFDLADRLPMLDLDRDEQLAADLLAPRYAIDSQGRRVVESKDVTKRRLGRSPDRADALLLAFTGGQVPSAFSGGGGSPLRDTFGDHARGDRTGVYAPFKYGDRL